MKFLNRLLLLLIFCFVLAAATGCAQESGAATTEANAATQAPSVTETPAPALAAPTDNAIAHNRPEGDFPLSDALELFFEQHPNAQLTQIQWKRESDASVYKIEGQENGREQELKVHANYGNILRSDTDDEDDDRGDFFDYAAAIPVREAFDKALAALDGEWVPVSWELDNDNGVLEYEFHFERTSGDDDADVRIHAETGEVRKIDD